MTLQADPDGFDGGKPGFRNGMPAYRTNGGWDPRDAKSRVLLRLFKQGYRAAFDDLFRMWGKDINDFALRSLRDPGDAEEVTQEVFMAVSVRLASFSPEADHSFRGWLFQIARNRVINFQKRRARIRFQSLEQMAELVDEDRDPNEEGVLLADAEGQWTGTWATSDADSAGDDLLSEEDSTLSEEGSSSPPADRNALVAAFTACANRIDEQAVGHMADVSGWLEDEDLLKLFKLLPEPQQQALTLLCVKDLAVDQIAAVMGRTSDDVYQLLSRGTRQIREKLSKVAESRLRRCRRPAMLRGMRPHTVLRTRRFALQGSSRPPHALARTSMSPYRPPPCSRW